MDGLDVSGILEELAEDRRPEARAGEHCGIVVVVGAIVGFQYRSSVLRYQVRDATHAERRSAKAKEPRSLEDHVIVRMVAIRNKHQANN